MDDDMKIGICCFILGLLFGFVFTMAIIDDGYRQIMEQETLDEICTELAGEPSEYSMEETTRHKLICNPTNDPKDIILDDGAIVLRGYENISYLHNKGRVKDESI